MLEFQQPIPDIAGLQCSAALAQEFWYGGERVSAVNVLFLGLADGTWHRVALDSGIVFWRVEARPSFPSAADNSEQYGQHPLVDLGAKYSLAGRTIESVTSESTIEGEELHIRFAGNAEVILRDRQGRDATELIVQTPAA